MWEEGAKMEEEDKMVVRDQGSREELGAARKELQLLETQLDQCLLHMQCQAVPISEHCGNWE